MTNEDGLADDGTPTNPPVEAETATGPDGKPLQAREPAQPAGTPRDEAGAATPTTSEAAPTQPSPDEERRAEDQVQRQESGAGSGEVGAVPSFDVTLRIRRFNPESD